MIEGNFTQMRDVLERHKNEVIQAVTQEKNKEITELRGEIKAKEEKMRVKDAEGKGKDEMIESLNMRIN